MLEARAAARRGARLLRRPTRALRFVGQARARRRHAAGAAPRPGARGRPLRARRARGDARGAAGSPQSGRCGRSRASRPRSPARCKATLDLRHEDPAALAQLRERACEAAHAAAADEGAELEIEPLWSIEPVPFDPALVEAAARPSPGSAGAREPLPSGPLHDAAAMARAGVPTAMLFVQSRGGLSHTAAEDTDEAHLELGVRALAELTAQVLGSGTAAG